MDPRLILDTRPPFYYRQKHLESSVNIYATRLQLSAAPLSQFPQSCFVHSSYEDFRQKFEKCDEIIVLQGDKNDSPSDPAHILSSAIRCDPALLSKKVTLWTFAEFSQTVDPDRVKIHNPQKAFQVRDIIPTEEEEPSPESKPLIISRKGEPPILIPNFADRIPLSPIQQWFFDARHPNENWFNQSGRFQSSPDILIPKCIQPTMQKLIFRHSAFRTRFIDLKPDAKHSDQPRDIFQYIMPPSYLHEQVLNQTYRYHDLSNDNPETFRATIEKIAYEANSSLNIERGPLGKIEVFFIGSTHLVLIVLHHLVVDGVSWRIIADDLKTFYLETKQKQESDLFPSLTGWREWISNQLDYATSAECHRTLTYWKSKKDFPLLPWDDIKDISSNHMEQERLLKIRQQYKPGVFTPLRFDHVTIRFDHDTTDKILRIFPKTFKTKINDVLLTALAVALQSLTKKKKIGICLEGHGRESTIQGAVEKTVGWFTSLFPVVLIAGHPSDDPEMTLQSIKSQLEDMPENGLGFGILKYLTEEGKQHLNFALPEVSFNYLGQMGFSAQKTLPKPASYDPQNLYSLEDTTLINSTITFPSGPVVSPEHLAHVLIDINGSAGPAGLAFDFGYCSDAFCKETIEKLGKDFYDCLLGFLKKI